MNTHRLTPDALRAALQREQQIVEMANRRRPALAAARASILIKDKLPDAATLVFAVTDDIDGFNASLEAVLDADARLLWHGDVPIGSAAAFDLHYRGGLVDDALVDTDGAEYRMLIEGADLNHAAARPLADDIVRRITTGQAPQMVGVDIAEAIRFAALIIDPVAITVAELARLLPTYTALLNPDDVQPLIDALTSDVTSGDTPPLQPPSFVTRLQELIGDWRHYDDTALINLIERFLTQYECWSDEYHTAAVQRRERGVDPELCAYDGSNQPQKRPLTGRERDILVRVLNDILFGLADRERSPLVRRVIRFGDDNDVARLHEMRRVLDPRNGN